MKASVDLYHQQITNHLAHSAHPDWFKALQLTASKQLEAFNLPARSDEEWKYTRLDSFLNQPFIPNQSNDALSSFVHTQPGFEILASQRNNTLHLNQDFIAGLPKGVIVAPLLSALITHAHHVQPYLNQILTTTHGFQALNTALMQTGLFIYVPKGVVIETPMVIQHYQNQPENALHIRHLIVLDEGSQANVIEHYQGEQTCCYFTNAVTEIYLDKNAQLTHYKIQEESMAAFHVGHLAVWQQENSQYDSHVVSLGGLWVRSDLTAELKETKATCLMNGIYLPAMTQHIDHHTTVTHHVPACRSDQDYKGILAERACAVFNGKVKVVKYANHTEAQQQNKNMLLSDLAQIMTKPQLEIFADDVVCTHGATVGQLDEDALFYLTSRGINAQKAQSYLLKAFIFENLKRIPMTMVASWITDLINQKVTYD
ncbi:MAG: Fe-S cluster assembly protein SufD [Legionellaceae bacterium]|nr:Fe-S cluster assembly protein SufD [Legionellaceae bacterium]HCA89333.1 Fe-S cluster assembly protein SufD [Legionellales bacterium]|tara:strand:- start:193 stop:1476 length:1284 start_codon:yes stop_codon:yes gene_type:complete